MDLNQTLLNMCEEFFDEITNKENNENLDSDIHHLRQKLERNLYGYTKMNEYSLAVLVEEEISNIWHEISTREKRQNPELECHYREIMAVTTDVIEHREEDEFDDDEPNLENLVDEMDESEWSYDYDDSDYDESED